MNEEGKKKLEHYLSTASDINLLLIKLIDLTDLETTWDEIPPIAIYYHNKTIDIYKLLNEKNISYKDSLINEGFHSYMLRKLIKESIQELEEYININYILPRFLRATLGKKLSEKSIETYRNNCQKVLYFSIENDIEEVLNFEIDRQINDPKYDGAINKIINTYNKELNQLGINKTIKHIESENKYILIETKKMK